MEEIKKQKLSWLRRLGIWFLSSLLAVIILVGVPLAATSPFLTDRDDLKSILHAPGIYESIKSAVGELKIEPSDKETARRSKQNQALIKELFNRYFTADLYQRLTTEIPDGVYDWLEDKSPTIEFSVPITTDKAEFKEFITDGFVAKYKSLPVCKPGQQPGRDIFNAKCRVRISDKQLRAAIAKDLNGPEFDKLFSQATLSSTNLTPVDNQNTQNIKLAYKVLKILPWAVFGLIVLISGLLFVLAKFKLYGFRVVGRAILIPSLLVLLGSIAWYIFDDFIMRMAQAQLAETAVKPALEPLTNLLKTVISKINDRRTIYSSVLTALGVAGLVAHRKLNPKSLPDDHLTDHINGNH